MATEHVHQTTLPTLPNGVRLGQTLNGKYILEGVIGTGGVGLVLSALNMEMGERVALKFLRPEVLHDTDVVARFAREAKAAVSIKNEHVATIYDVGTLPDGAPYMVMEYLH